MSEEYITRREHEEFARRMDTENQRRDDENNRQNHRIGALEESVKKIEDLTLSIRDMTAQIQNMTKEIGKQGEKLETIERKPGQRWELLITGIIGAVGTIIGGGVVAAVVSYIH